MAFLRVNGVDFPSPKRGTSIVVETNVNSGRNANAVVVGQRIGRDQYKIDNLEWSYLSAEKWAEMLTILSNFFINVTFRDPVSNRDKTIRMYVGNRSAEPFWVDKDGKPTHFINCKANLIDTGE